jgi:hypothetical protein
MGFPRVRAADFRRLVAKPVFHMSEPAWKVMQSRLAARGDFEAAGVLPRGGHNEVLKPEGCAVLMLAAMMPQPNALGLAQHIRRRFQAEATSACPITRATRYGDALTRCLADPNLARHLDLVELAHDFAAGRLLWKHYRPSEFMEGTDQHEWRLRHDAANSRFGIGALKFTLLHGAAVAEIARALAADVAADRSRRVSAPNLQLGGLRT